MKIIISTLALIIILSSCVKAPKQGVQSGESVDFVSMKVPANFDWKMSSNVTCSFTSPTHASEISLSLNGADAPFSTLVIDATTKQIVLSIPKTETSFVVQYLKADGLSTPTTLNIINGAVQYTVPSDSKPIIETKAKIEGGKQYTHYPASDKYGTLMFEDLWPSKGDYDLNDMVANYKVTLSGTANSNAVGMIKVELRVVAVGGSEPFNLYLQLDKIKSTDILDAIMEAKFLNTVENPKINFLSRGTANPVLISLEGIRKNLKGVSNNMKNDNLAVKDMAYVSFTLYSDEVDGLSINDLTEDDFNFFIAKEDGSRLKEVHLGGSAPSYLGKELYDEYKKSNSNINRSADYYYSNERLVWALKVPNEIPHSVEKVDFTIAYPNFKAWVESGATINKDWYHQPDIDNTISVK